MWGGLGLKSFSYWPQNSNPSTTQGFWHHWLFLHIRVLCCFSFLVLFFDIWVYKQKISLGSSMLLLSAPIHSPAVNVPVARCVGHTLQTWYWWEDEGVLDGKDACYIMVQAIFQPPWSGGRVTSLDKLFLRWIIFRHTPHSGIRLSEWFISPPVFHLEVCPVSCHYHVCSGHYSLYTAIAVYEI